MSLSPEQEASFTKIIDGILAASDLSTISAKRVRRGLQSAVGYDITPQKDDITKLILARFDRATEAQVTNGDEPSPVAPAAPPAPVVAPAQPAPAPAYTAPRGFAFPPSSAPISNGVSNHTTAPSTPAKREHLASSPPTSAHTLSVLPPTSRAADDSQPPKKKHKKTASTVEDDEEFARRLQAEENSRGRTTRGGGPTSSAKKRGSAKNKLAVKKKKAKSAKTVGGSDDSDLSSPEEKEVKRTGGFHKPMALSAPLSALLHETQLSRPQTVKKVWEHIKLYDLQDPADKRQIRCDDAMRAVFKSDRVHMFTMNKILNQNLYAVDE